MQLIDTHCHLNLGQYETDQDTVIENALKAGVSQILTPGVSLESFSSAQSLHERYPKIFRTAVGIHPTEAAQLTPEAVDFFAAQCPRPQVVAVGETGLDYYWDSCPEDVQQYSLREHIRLAKAQRLPLILHIRDKKDSQRAYDDVLRILQEENARTIGGVMHCFSGTLAFAKAVIAENFKVAFGGVLTFKSARDLQAVARELPLEHILLETDSPWLCPEPHRGQRNEPAYVAHVARKLADLRGCDLETVARVTTANARQLFKL